MNCRAFLARSDSARTQGQACTLAPTAAANVPLGRPDRPPQHHVDPARRQEQSERVGLRSMMWSEESQAPALRRDLGSRTASAARTRGHHVGLGLEASRTPIEPGGRVGPETTSCCPAEGRFPTVE
jgi:hypothetical protein